MHRLGPQQLFEPLALPYRTQGRRDAGRRAITSRKLTLAWHLGVVFSVGEQGKLAGYVIPLLTNLVVSWKERIKDSPVA